MLYILSTLLLLFIIQIVYVKLKFNGEIIHKKGKNMWLLWHPIVPTFRRKFQLTLTFSVLSKYIIREDKQKDGNKLYGVTTNNSFRHHKESARFIWRYSPEEGVFEIGVREYIKGKAYNQYFPVRIHYGEPVGLKIQKSRGMLQYYLCYDETEYSLRLKERSWFSMMLFPYFGGSETPPEEVLYRIDYGAYDNKNVKKFG